MKKSTRSKHKVRGKCPECGSVVHRDLVDGITTEFCSNDLLPEYAQYFRWFQDQKESVKASLMVSWPDYKHNLYSTWYISTQDPSQPFECTYMVDPHGKLPTPSKCEVTIPDPAQVMLAERILRRPLTEEERVGVIAVERFNPDGTRYFIDRHYHIPIIDEEGNMGEDTVSHVRIPTDVSVKFKDMTYVYNPERSPKLFDWEDL